MLHPYDATAARTGRAHFREVEAEHVDGDMWRFVSVTTGKPFVVKNDKGQVSSSTSSRRRTTSSPASPISSR